jgi:hypothetical protein
MNESETLIEQKEEGVRQRTPRLAAQKALPQSSAETLVKIIKGYAVASNGGQTKINYKDVASVAGLSPTIVSANNKFLLESQILSSPQYGYYIPTENAVRFARESAWDESGAKAHLRKVIAYSWYGQVAVQNFVLRAKLTRSELKRSLAIKCGATEADSNALEFLIDFMVYTDLIGTDEKGALERGQAQGDGQGSNAIIEIIDNSLEADRSVSSIPPVQPNGGARLSIHLHIRDFDELTPSNAARVREWLKAVATEDETEVHIDTLSAPTDASVTNLGNEPA